MNKTNKFQYKCINCGKTYEPHEVKYLCPKCSSQNTPELAPKGVLNVIYDYKNIHITRPNPIDSDNINHKYLSLLPIESVTSLPNLRVGNTPIYRIENDGIDDVFFIKDESQNPTYSFKDRASAMVSAFAKEKGINRIVAASTGNAGSSIAGICASQKQLSVVLVPANAPIAKLTQILMYGAQIVPVEGTYDQAFDLSIALSEATGWYNRNTAFNPITIEGKKTVAFEIFEQFGGQIPDYIYVPVGDGVILAGIYKGFEDLINCGLLAEMPKIVCVQATKSNNIIRNIHTVKPIFEEAHSVADSINVTIPRNYFMAVHYLKKFDGITVEVTDEEILKASLQLSQKTGLFAEPASSAAFAGYLQLRQLKNENAKHLIIHTGCGLKDLSSVRDVLPKIQSVRCDISSVKKVLKI